MAEAAQNQPPAAAQSSPHAPALAKLRKARENVHAAVERVIADLEGKGKPSRVGLALVRDAVDDLKDALPRARAQSGG
jgi:hypothetical protein